MSCHSTGPMSVFAGACVISLDVTVTGEDAVFMRMGGKERTTSRPL
jgi:hypothetical protein